MTLTVDIRYGDQIAGLLALDKTLKLPVIHYTEEWQKGGFPIAPALSLQGPDTPASAYNYLDNLLPEGRARELLAQDLGVSEKNVFRQVSVLGNDLSGGFVFGEAVHDKPIFREVSEAEMTKRIEQKEDSGLLHWDDKPRLSVAGVQDKLNVFVAEDGTFGFGDGSLLSTHILKFERAGLPHLVLNEFVCMCLARLTGLPVANVEFKRFGKFPALLVKRFDRNYLAAQKKVRRRHVIDGCQALDLSRDYKYERNFGDGRDVKHIRDGASLPQLFNFCRQSSSPAKNILQLLQWQLFNLMISNYDSHAKNISFYWGRHVSELTPSYDLVNIAMFPQFKQVLAMAMGDEFEPANLGTYDLADFADSCGIKRQLVSSTLKQLAGRLTDEIAGQTIARDLFEQQLISKQESDYVKEVIGHIQDRTTELTGYADGIVDVEL